MKYEEIEEYLEKNPRCRINFREFTEDINGIKREILTIEGYEVVSFIRPNEFIDKEKIFTYYGEVEHFENYCFYPYLRVIIKAPEKKDIFTGSEDREYYVLHLNRAYFSSNLQEIDLFNETINNQSMGAIKPWQ